MNILIIDDEKDVKRLFEQRFRREIKSGEVQLFFAHTSEEALAFLDQEDLPDLKMILSDINIPSINGLDLLQLIRPKFPEITIYMITAYGNEEYKAKAKAYGADEYYTKPINFRALKDQLMKLELAASSALEDTN